MDWHQVILVNFFSSIHHPGPYNLHRLQLVVPRTVTKYIYLSIVLKYTFCVSVLYWSIIFSGNL